MALSRRNRPNRPRVGFLCRQCITYARKFSAAETFHQQSDGIAVDTAASTACPRRCVKPVFLCFELFVYDLNLLVDYFAGESVDRDVDPVRCSPSTTKLLRSVSPGAYRPLCAIKSKIEKNTQTIFHSSHDLLRENAPSGDKPIL